MTARPLRRILSIQSAAVAVLPFVAMAVFGAIWWLPQVRSGIESRQMQLVATVSSQIESYLNSSLELVQGLASMIDAGRLGEVHTQEMLDGQLQASHSLRCIYVVGPEGRVRAVAVQPRRRSQHQDLMGLDMSRNRLWQKVHSAPSPEWSDTFLSVVGGGLSVAVAVPSDPLAIIGEIDLSLLTRFLNRIATVDEQLILVLDRRGQVIADKHGRYTAQQLNLSNIPLVKSVMTGASPAIDQFYFKGREMIGSAMKTDLLDWYVMVAIPRDAAYSPLWTSVNIIATSLLITLLAGVVLVLLMSRRLATPFEKLARHARLVAAGRTPGEWPKSNIAEFGELSSDLQQMAIAIGQREVYNRVLFADSPIPLVVIDPETERIVDGNDAARRIYAFASNQEMAGRRFLDFATDTQPDDTASQEAFQAHLRHCRAKGFTSFEWRQQNHDGAIWYAEIHLSSLHFGQRPLMQMSINDTTQRRQAEMALVDSEAKFRQVTETIHEVFWLVTVDWSQVLYISPAYEVVWGRSREALYRDPLSWMEAVIEADRQAVRDAIPEPADLTGEIRFPEYRIRRPDGVVRWISARAYPVFDDRGQVYRVAGIAEDISDRKAFEQEQEKLEHRLRQSQKMEAVGTMAGGIAHDFNNILSIVVGNAELAADETPDWTPVRSYLEEIKTACLRARDVVRQLLSFSRQSDQERKPINLNVLVKESVTLLRASISAAITIRSEGGNENGTVLADPTQIHQILINLCTNAAHAMEAEGGVLSISTAAVAVTDEAAANYSDLKPGQYVQLTVADTGHGISPEIIRRVFDPYFTTKGVDKGTGMGLAIVHGIVKGHDGWIGIDSLPGQGTRVDILLPTVGVPAPETTAVKPRLLTGSERVLFVDDEAQIAGVAGSMLTKLGYTVTVSTSSTEALTIFNADPSRFDLVITDLTMPDMTGDVLAGQMLALRPDLPIVICTGYSRKLSAEAAAAIGVGGFLTKPVEIATLATTVREVLDRGGSAASP